MSGRISVILCSAFLLASEVKLLKMTFMASEDMVWGAAFSGHGSSSFCSKTLNTVIPWDYGDCPKHFISFLIREVLFTDPAQGICYSIVLTLLVLESYFASSFIHLCFMASMLGEVRKYVRGLLSVQILKQ